MSAFKEKMPSISSYKIAYEDDGRRIEFSTFVEAAEHYGLMESDEIWIKTLEEAADRLHGTWRFTRFFGQLLLFSNPSNPLSLFNRFLPRMIGVRNYHAEELLNLKEIVLRRLYSIFANENKTCSHFGLPEPQDFDLMDDDVYRFPNIQEAEGKFRIIFCYLQIQMK